MAPVPEVALGEPLVEFKDVTIKFPGCIMLLFKNSVVEWEIKTHGFWISWLLEVWPSLCL